MGITVDGAGDVYVTDTGNHRIEKFDREGNFMTQWGGFGNGDGQFNFPYGIAVDARGAFLSSIAATRGFSSLCRQKRVASGSRMKRKNWRNWKKRNERRRSEEGTMLDKEPRQGLTYDDVVLVPAKSQVLPNEVDTGTFVSRNIRINIPLVSAAMDTVTESRLAIAMAREGGIGIIHRVLSPADQAIEVDKVKNQRAG